MLYSQKCIFDSNIITTRMIAEAGYIKDQFSKHFLEVKKRTWARVYSVSSVLDNFLNKYPDGQIVSLGCGYDTTYFTLREQYPEKKFKYFQIDFPQIIKKKIDKIGKCKRMVELITSLAQELDAKQQQSQEAKKQKLSQSLKMQSYFIIGEDLRNINQQNLKSWNLQSQQKNQFNQLLQVQFRTPTIIVSQVVLIYMSAEQSENIIAQLADYFKGPLVFTTYQMIHPNDPFGKMMVGNLEDRGCPLRGIKDCPDQIAQVERYKSVGKCSAVFVENMLTVYNKYLDSERRLQAQKIQFFDEFQEWNMLQSHYCLVIGVKNVQNENNDDDSSNQDDSSLQTSIFLKQQKSDDDIGETISVDQQEKLKFKLEKAKLMKQNKFMD